MSIKDKRNIQLPKKPYPTRPGDAPFSQLIQWLDQKRDSSIQESKREIKDQAISKLELLDDIHQVLVKNAQSIVDEANLNIKLHDIPIHVLKTRGQIYYLYKSSNKDKIFFSILEPEEYFQADASADFLAAYRLNEDSSWSLITPLDPDDIIDAEMSGQSE